MEISGNCAALQTSIQPTIGTLDLYEGVHLNKAEVRTFAITLKDFTLDHNPDNLTHTDAATSNYRPSRYQQESLRKSIIHVQTRPP